jgi:hypothetical protein
MLAGGPNRTRTAATVPTSTSPITRPSVPKSQERAKPNPAQTMSPNRTCREPSTAHAAAVQRSDGIQKRRAPPRNHGAPTTASQSQRSAKTKNETLPNSNHARRQVGPGRDCPSATSTRESGRSVIGIRSCYSESRTVARKKEMGRILGLNCEWGSIVGVESDQWQVVLRSAGGARMCCCMCAPREAKSQAVVQAKWARKNHDCSHLRFPAGASDGSRSTPAT